MKDSSNENIISDKTIDEINDKKYVSYFRGFSVSPFFIIVLVIFAKILSYLLIEPELPVQYSIFNINGSIFGYPSITEIIIPCILVLILYNGQLRNYKINWNYIILSLASTLLLILCLLAIWLIVFNQVNPVIELRLNKINFLRFFQAVVSSIAFYLAYDSWKTDRRYRLYLVLLFLPVMLFQDMPGFLTFLPASFWLGAFLLFSQKVYKIDKLAGILSTVSFAVFIIFISISNYHQYVHLRMENFIIPGYMLQLTTFLLFAFILRKSFSSKHSVRIILSISFLFVLGISVFSAIWKPIPELSHGETIGNVRLEYGDKALAKKAREIAVIIDAANQVSLKHFGFIPSEKISVRVYGEGTGGGSALQSGVISFFINSKKGIFVVKPPKDVSKLDDGEWLVMADILHEYAHQYGSISYLPWLLGAKNEGWATFASLRLMQYIYDDYGPSLLSKPFNYGQWARTIDQFYLRNEKDIAHQNEWQGYRYWSSLANKIGEKKLFTEVYKATTRSIPGKTSISNKAETAKIDNLAKQENQIQNIKSIFQSQIIHDLAIAAIFTLAILFSKRKVSSYSVEPCAQGITYN